MGVDKIIKLVGVLVAVVAGVMGGFAYSATLVAILGLAGGWFIASDDRMRFLVATLAIAAVAGALGTPDGGAAMVIPVVGDYISDALGGVAALFSAAAVTVIVMGIVDAVKP